MNKYNFNFIPCDINTDQWRDSAWRHSFPANSDISMSHSLPSIWGKKVDVFNVIDRDQGQEY